MKVFTRGKLFPRMRKTEPDKVAKVEVYYRVGHTLPVSISVLTTMQRMLWNQTSFVKMSWLWTFVRRWEFEQNG